MPKPSHDLVDMDWLVKERSRIQDLSCQLLSLMKMKKEEILEADEISDAVLLIVGAAFSLWRAVFLAHISKEQKKNFEDAQEFVEQFVRHNSISYMDDVRHQTWSFGYYLNNCRFRLQYIRDKLDMGLDSASWLDDPLPIDINAQVEWTKHFEALALAFQSLSSSAGQTSSAPTSFWVAK